MKSECTKPQPTKLHIEQTVRRLCGQYNLNSKQNIGSYSDLYKRYNPKTAYEFAQAIKDDAALTGKKDLRGVLAQLVDVSNRENTGLTEDQLKAGMFQFLVHDTFNGLHKEVTAVERLTERFPALHVFQDADLDTDYAVDILIDAKVNGETKMVLGIQVKPTSYFNPTNDIHRRNIEIDKEKNRKFVARYETGTVFYLIYDGRTNQFTNWDSMIQRIENSYRDVVLQSKLLNQKTGIDFIMDDETLDEADMDMMIAILERKKKQRRG